MSNEKLGAEQGRALIEECGLALAAEEITCGHKHVKTFNKLNEVRELAEQAYHARGAGPCAHKQLKKQMVGEQVWYVCECGQKFRIEMWDGKVTVREPGADTGITPPPYEGPWCDCATLLICACGTGFPHCEDCGNFLDSAAIERMLVRAAERGTTPPEGLREDGIERLIEAGRLISLLSDESGKPCDGFRFRDGVAEIRAALTALGRAPYQCDAATQRAPVEQGAYENEAARTCAKCGKTERGWKYNRCPDCGELAPDHAREGALHDRVVAMRAALKPYLRESLRPEQILAIDVAIQAELERALADGKEGGK